MEPGEFHIIISVNMFDGTNNVNISQVTGRYVLMYIPVHCNQMCMRDLL